MRNKLLIVFCMLICICFGGLITYMFLYRDPEQIIKTITEKNVTITDTGIADAVDKVKDAVVVVENIQRNTLAGTGTGFVYKIENNEAYIMTNHHVIENASDIKVIFSDNSEVSVQLIGSDKYADIAVLKVNSKSVIKVANLGKSNDSRIGDSVFTIGSPMGIAYAGTVTKGILSGKDRLVSVSISGRTYDWIMNVMQTDAAINPGNTGAPLCNANGEVIGINSMKIVQNTVEGIGFAIPIEDALEYASSLIKEGKITRPYIGITMIDASSTFQLMYSGIRLDSNINEGVVIASVEKGTPAEESKLEVGDVIIKVGNNKVSNIAEFRYRLFKYELDDTVSLTIIRDGKEKTVNVKLKKN